MRTLDVELTPMDIARELEALASRIRREWAAHEARSESVGTFAWTLHRCKVCGTLWKLWESNGFWSLLNADQRPGQCCDNVAMGDQIEPKP